MSISLIVFIVFLTLKLSGVITWSWWLVTLPLWWWLPTIIVIITLCVLYILIAEYFKEED